MGRIEKQKRILIEQANRRLLGETISAEAFNKENIKKIGGLSYVKYLKNIKGIVTSMITLGQQMLSKSVGIEMEEKASYNDEKKLKQEFCEFVKTEMNSDFSIGMFTHKSFLSFSDFISCTISSSNVSFEFGRVVISTVTPSYLFVLVFIL